MVDVLLFALFLAGLGLGGVAYSFAPMPWAMIGSCAGIALGGWAYVRWSGRRLDRWMRGDKP